MTPPPEASRGPPGSFPGPCKRTVPFLKFAVPNGVLDPKHIVLRTSYFALPVAMTDSLVCQKIVIPKGV